MADRTTTISASRTRRCAKFPTVLALAVLWTAACQPPKTYCVRRAALVPVPAPALRPAKRTDGPIELNFSSETLSYARPPSKAPGANVGLYVPRQQFAGSLLFSPLPSLAFGLSYEGGLAQGALPITEGLIDPPSGGVSGFGLHAEAVAKVHRRITVSVSCDAGPYWISSRVGYHELEAGGSCSDLPDPNTWPNKQVHTTVPFLRFQVAAGFDLGWSHLTLGTGVRTQPYNKDATKEVVVTTDQIGPEVTYTAYPYLYALWEIQVTRWLGLGLAVYEPLNFKPIVFAPIFGLTLRLTPIAHDRFTARPTAPPTPQPRPAPDAPIW